MDSLREDKPLLRQKIRECTFPILKPRAPLSASLCDRIGPAGKATRRPLFPARWGQSEAICLGPREDEVREGEQIRGPFEELVRYRCLGHGLPDRRYGWRLRL